MKLVYDYTFEDWKNYLVENGYKEYIAKQIFDWLYKKKVNSFLKMTNIQEKLRSTLEKEFYFDALKLELVQKSQDGTNKYLFKLKNEMLIETVLMRFDYGNTVCVTTQVGCNMGCTFCASGLLKKKHDLTSGEIVAQIMMISQDIEDLGERVSNIVVMGIGEPFDNYKNLMSFIRTVNDDRGLAIGARHITVSTCGVIDKIKKFADEKIQVNLAISLHAPNDELRSQLMPINRAYNLEKLFEALNYYSQKSKRRITFEYILLQGINDTMKCIYQLKSLIQGMNAYVNLIPYNPVSESGYKSVDDRGAMWFYNELKKQKINCTLRQKQGDDIDAACGQLRAKHERKEEDGILRN